MAAPERFAERSDSSCTAGTVITTYCAADADGRFSEDCVAKPGCFFAARPDLSIGQLVAFYRHTRLADRLRRTGDCGRWWRAAEELGEAPQVLSGCGQ